DVARGSKLAVRPSRIEARKQILVEIALNILVLGGNLHVVDRLAGLDKKARLVDLELGTLHVLAKGPGFRTEFLEKWKYFLFDDFEGLVARQLAPVGPAQFFITEEWLILLSALFCGALGILLAFIELLKKN